MCLAQFAMYYDTLHASNLTNDTGKISLTKKLMARVTSTKLSQGRFPKSKLTKERLMKKRLSFQLTLSFRKTLATCDSETFLLSLGFIKSKKLMLMSFITLNSYPTIHGRMKQNILDSNGTI